MTAQRSRPRASVVPCTNAEGPRAERPDASARPLAAETQSVGRTEDEEQQHARFLQIENNMTPSHVSRIAAHIGLSVPETWTGIDAVWPLVERMRQDGAIVIIKVDGERTGPRDTGPYTFVISGTPVDAELIRTDAHSLEGGLSFVITKYASTVWKIPLPC